MIRRLIWPVSLFAAVVLATGAGLVLALLVHGRAPDSSAVAPVVVGTVGAVIVGVLTAPAVREGIRSAVPGLRRAPSEISRRIAEAAAQRLPTDELLLRSAEALRSGLDSPRVEIWLRADAPDSRANQPALARTTTLGVSTAPPPMSSADLVAAARAGVAGEGWARRWLPQLLTGESGAENGAVDAAALPGAAPAAPAGTARLAEQATRRAPTRIGAITESGELLGLLVVGRRPGARGYEYAEDDALGAACRMLAAILRNRALTLALEASLTDLQRTNEELAASRTRVVTAADAERRRIERDLHDGAQQHLLALAVTVGLLRQMVVEGDPREEVADVLGQLGDDVRTAVGELRSLAQGIYPALLMDSGLAPALRAAAGRSALPVRVIAAEIGRYPANLEAAVYFCCLEALQNAAKHAPTATQVTVTMAVADDVLRAEIHDDGPGFDASAPSAGMGRASMADRVGALGGMVRWESAPRAGTTVHLAVPLPSADAGTSDAGTGHAGTGERMTRDLG